MECSGHGQCILASGECSCFGEYGHHLCSMRVGDQPGLNGAICSFSGMMCEAPLFTLPPRMPTTPAPTFVPIESMCSPGCANRWLGDGNCDAACMTESCAYDQGDCVTTTTLPPVRVCSCPRAWIADGVCNPECNTQECDSDGGDCSLTTAPAVLDLRTAMPTAAPWTLLRPTDSPTLGPTTSSPTSVPNCAPACKPEWLGDGSCDLQCNVPSCKNDNGDCAVSSSWCSPGCNPSNLGDGFCDSACNHASCKWDNGDCKEIANSLDVRTFRPPSSCSRIPSPLPFSLAPQLIPPRTHHHHLHPPLSRLCQCTSLWLPLHRRFVQ